MEQRAPLSRGGWEESQKQPGCSPLKSTERQSQVCWPRPEHQGGSCMEVHVQEDRHPVTSGAPSSGVGWVKVKWVPSGRLGQPLGILLLSRKSMIMRTMFGCSKQYWLRGQSEPPRLETRKYHWLPPCQSKCPICRFKFCYLPTSGPSFSFGHDQSRPSGSTASNLAASHPFITPVPEYYFQIAM